MIKDILSSNDVAFVIGNGINQHFFSDVKSWQKLLESLWIRYCQNTSSGNDWEKFVDSETRKLKGITITELFDLIEMNCYDYSSSNKLQNYWQKDYSNNLKLLSPKVKKELKEMASAGYAMTRDELIEEFNKMNDDFKANCRNWCNENIVDARYMTDADCAFKMIEFLSNSTKIQLYRNKLKQEIADEYQADKNSDALCTFMRKIKQRNAPVLTTNFDTYMSFSLGLRMPNKMGASFTDFYPWNVYFSDDKLQSPVSGFGIWHINGLRNYPRSIRLGLSDYMGSVEKARNMIHYKNMNEFFDGKNTVNWVGRNTWLHIVFNKPLFIFGLALDENEVFLRWLLIQRAKYSKMYGRDLKGWFVDKDINKGKRVFLETLGFTVINLTSFDELYDAF